jgi:hypothetical protein
VSGAGGSLIDRAFGWYRALGASRRVSVAALILANAIPIVGVLFFGWSLMTILVLYWIENGIVGLWNIPRMLLARGPDPVPQGVPTAVLSGGCQRLILIPFFIVHYGIFWLGHGFLLFFLAGFGLFRGALDPGPAPLEPIGGFPLGLGGSSGGAFGAVDPGAIAFAGAVMLVSHGISFVKNYLGDGEYLRTTAVSRMAAVYGRVIVLHLAILLGGFAIAAIGAPIWILVVLVIGKTLLDLRLHAKEHGV